MSSAQACTTESQSNWARHSCDRNINDIAAGLMVVGNENRLGDVALKLFVKLLRDA